MKPKMLKIHTSEAEYLDLNNNAIMAPVAGQVRSPAAATSPAAPPTTTTKGASGGRRSRLMLTGVVVLLVAIALAIALFLVFGRAL
jgi:hypothetical protein